VLHPDEPAANAKVMGTPGRPPRGRSGQGRSTVAVPDATTAAWAAPGLIGLAGDGFEVRTGGLNVPTLPQAPLPSPYKGLGEGAWGRDLGFRP